MEKYEGFVVKSRAGRDKGLLYLVINTDGEFVYVANGDTRKVEIPKKKKLKHNQKTSYYAHNIRERLLAGGLVENHEMRKALAEYLK